MIKQESRPEIQLEGLPVSPGVAIGRVFLVDLPAVDTDGDTIKPSEVDGELASLATAVKELRTELQRACAEASGPEKEIRRAHLMLLDDPHLIGEIERVVAEDQLNVPAAIKRVNSAYEATFQGFEERIIRERALDIRDVCTQLLNMHIDRYQRTLFTAEEQMIVAARDLLPSQTARLDRTKLLGIISELGGTTSHTAILARSYGIPAVCGVDGLISALHPGAQLVIDGTSGRVVVDPKPETLEAFLRQQEDFRAERLKVGDYEGGPVLTEDGVAVTLMANVNRPDDMTDDIGTMAEGVGLFRTEYYFMTQRELPTEDEQYKHYRHLLEQAHGKEVIIRTLDAGGDKDIGYLKAGHEDNPMMGCRSVRLCLQHPEVILPQIRAILRAAVHGDVRVMFPLVSTRSELERVTALITRAREELKSEGVEHQPDVPIGLLVEVPAAALNIRNLLPLVDFISVGTNDLTQYTLAVDRGNPRVAHLYQPLHPAVLRLLAMMTREGRIAGKPVSMCGEMAGDLENTVLLLGLGYRRLSVSPYLLPPLRRIVRRVNVERARRLAAQALKLGSRRDIRALLEPENRRVSTAPDMGGGS